MQGLDDWAASVQCLRYESCQESEASSRLSVWKRSLEGNLRKLLNFGSWRWGWTPDFWSWLSITNFLFFQCPSGLHSTRQMQLEHRIETVGLVAPTESSGGQAFLQRSSVCSSRSYLFRRSSSGHSLKRLSGMTTWPSFRPCRCQTYYWDQIESSHSLRNHLVEWVFQGIVWRFLWLHFWAQRFEKSLSFRTYSHRLGLFPRKC